MIIAVTALHIACSSLTVRFDYDQEQDFSRYTSFAFYPIPEEIGADSSPLVIDRVKAAVIRELEAKGFSQTGTDPDLLIAIHTESRDKFSITSWGYHYAPYDTYWRGYGYWYGGGIDVHRYEEGTLVLDIVRADEDEMIWRGAASRALPATSTPEEIDDLVDRAVTGILENFPPPKKIGTRKPGSIPR
jgi:hypothetical protein